MEERTAGKIKFFTWKKGPSPCYHGRRAKLTNFIKPVMLLKGNHDI